MPNNPVRVVSKPARKALLVQPFLDFFPRFSPAAFRKADRSFLSIAGTIHSAIKDNKVKRLGWNHPIRVDGEPAAHVGRQVGIECREATWMLFAAFNRQPLRQQHVGPRSDPPPELKGRPNLVRPQYSR